MSTTSHENDVVWRGQTVFCELPIRRLAVTIALGIAEGPLDSPEFSTAIDRFGELNHLERVWAWTYLTSLVDEEDYLDRVKLAHVGIGTMVLESSRLAYNAEPDATGPLWPGDVPKPHRELLT